MSKAFKNLFPVLVLTVFFALIGCGGGGGGGNGEGQQPGDRNQQPQITVAPVADTFNWTGNTRLTAAAPGLLANDPPGSVIATADTASALGGAVSVNMATGAFTYDPPLGTQNVSDTFTYTVSGSAPVTVTINLVERIWYVDNTAANGSGTFGSRFNTLAQAVAASDAGDTIFVFAGDLTDNGQDQGITLKDGQKLIGEGVGLKVNGFPLVDPVPNAVISNAGLAAAGDSPVIMLSAGNEVAGFSVNAASNEGILALGGTGHNLHDNTITFDPVNGREGIRLLNVAGNNSVIANSITGSPRDGVKLANNEDQAGNILPATPVVAIVTMSRNTISNSAQDGITVNLDGAGTDVTLNIMTNSINTSGAAEGINVNGLGAATVTAVVSRNTVSNSTGEAMDLAANNASAMKVFAANNDLSLNGGLADFRNRTLAGSTAAMCTELENNSNTALNSTFRVENNSGGLFQLVEGVNDTAAVTVGAITPVLQGACGIALAGAALFEANCAICHTGNGLGFGNVGPDITNRTAAQIGFQLINNLTMSNIRLTAREVDAIAGALIP